MSNLEAPQIGQKIYIPSSRYISHGRDDIAGGLATITEVKEGGSACNWFVSVAEVPGASYNYEILMGLQAELKEKFGEHCAHRDPDCSPGSNPPDNGWNDPTERV
jgi:hypothetical protein